MIMNATSRDVSQQKLDSGQLSVFLVRTNEIVICKMKTLTSKNKVRAITNHIWCKWMTVPSSNLQEINSLVVWNMAFMTFHILGLMDYSGSMDSNAFQWILMDLSIQLGMSSSQLTKSIICQRPPTSQGWHGKQCGSIIFRPEIHDRRTRLCGFAQQIAPTGTMSISGHFASFIDVLLCHCWNCLFSSRVWVKAVYVYICICWHSIVVGFYLL